MQSREVVEAMVADSGIELTSLRVDGGMTANDTLMQLQADILGAEVVRPSNIETTALGAAFAAGIGTGYWSGLEEVRSLQAPDQAWEPEWSAERRDALAAEWDRAVERSLDWA